MKELIAFSLLLFVGFGALIALVLLPILAVALLLKLLFFVALLPFRFLGALFGLLATLAGGLFKVALSVVGLVGGILLFVGGLLFVPLVPLILIGMGVWLLLRLVGRRPAVGASA